MDRRARQLPRHVYIAIRSYVWMGDLLEEASRLEVLIFQQLLISQYRSGRYPLRLEQPHRLVLILLASPLSDDSVQFVLVLQVFVVS